MKINKNLLPSKTVMLLAGGFAFFLLLFFTAGFLGLYSLRRASVDTQQYIRAVDSARDIQVKFQRQFMTWKAIVLEGNNFETFRKNYHDFSYQADRVQDNLFNLAIMCAELEKVPAQIEELRAMHKQITGEFIRLIVDMEESNFRNRPGVIQKTYGKDQQALRQVDSIVQEIETAADRKIGDVRSYYYGMTMISFLAIALAVILMALYISREVIRSQELLEAKVRERTKELAEANEFLRKEIIERTRAEEKYRTLVDGSSDIVFSMDNSLALLHVNRSLKNIFKLAPEKLTGRNFIDLIHIGLRGDDLSRQLLKDKIDGFLADRRPLEFMAAFKAPHNIEPVEMEIRLEYIDIEGGGQILGKARKLSEDQLNDYLCYEKKKFIIKNSLLLSEALVSRITRSLSAFIEAREVSMLRMALNEIIINAIEHGNLNITFNEKSAAQEKGEYFALIASRQENPEYSDRKVGIEYSIDSKRAVYLITDEGDGFDHASMNERAIESINEEMIAHGRGISIVKSVFDSVKYNRKGNQVLLVKNLSGSGKVS